jgi:two-component system response regulator CpxR
MSIITVFNGSYCNATSIVKETMIRTGYELMDDNAVVAEARRLSGIAAEKIQRTFSSKISIFNKFTHDRERAAAYLKLALAQHAVKDRLLLWGMTTHLIPRSISHVLRICLIADTHSRAKQAGAKDGLPPRSDRKIHGIPSCTISCCPLPIRHRNRQLN